MNAFWNWLKGLFNEAKTKLTTYLAITTAGVAELPNMVDKNALDSIHAVVSDNTHKHIVAGLAVLTIWSRVRRSLKAGGTPPGN